MGEHTKRIGQSLNVAHLHKGAKAARAMARVEANSKARGAYEVGEQVARSIAAARMLLDACRLRNGFTSLDVAACVAGLEHELEMLEKTIAKNKR